MSSNYSIQASQNLIIAQRHTNNDGCVKTRLQPRKGLLVYSKSSDGPQREGMDQAQYPCQTLDRMSGQYYNIICVAMF